jgi:hypothetical protein
MENCGTVETYIEQYIGSIISSTDDLLRRSNKYPVSFLLLCIVTQINYFN